MDFSQNLEGLVYSGQALNEREQYIFNTNMITQAAHLEFWNEKYTGYRLASAFDIYCLMEKMRLPENAALKERFVNHLEKEWVFTSTRVQYFDLDHADGNRGHIWIEGQEGNAKNAFIPEPQIPFDPLNMEYSPGMVFLRDVFMVNESKNTLLNVLYSVGSHKIAIHTHALNWRGSDTPYCIGLHKNKDFFQVSIEPTLERTGLSIGVRS